MARAADHAERRADNIIKAIAGVERRIEALADETPHKVRRNVSCPTSINANIARLIIAWTHQRMEAGMHRNLFAEALTMPRPLCAMPCRTSRARWS